MSWQQEGPPKYLSIEQLRDLSKVNQWASAFFILLEYAMIAAAIVVCTHYWNPALYILTVMWIGTRQHALGIIGHDGIHHLLFKNKKVNDLVTDLLLFWPVATSMKYFRHNHMKHHRNLLTDDDPELKFKIRTKEFSFPVRLLRLTGIFLTDILGVSMFIHLGRNILSHQKDERLVNRYDFDKKEILRYNIFRFSFYAIIIAASIYFGLWKILLLYWVVPFITWFQLSFRIRLMADHTLVPDDSLMQTSVVIPNIFEEFFIVPRNFGYHLPHHMYMSIPFYRLPKAQRILMQNPDYAQNAFVVKGYWNMLLRAVKANLIYV